MNQPSLWLTKALQDLLEFTVAAENAIAARDAEVVAVQQKHNPAIGENQEKIAALTEEIEQFYRRNRKNLETDGKKSVQLSCGLVGLREPTNPALQPLNPKYSWTRIERAVRRLYRERFFHKAKAPTLDKAKLKSELTADQLAAVGLTLAAAENFFIELNRLAPADAPRQVAA